MYPKGEDQSLISYLQLTAGPEDWRARSNCSKTIRTTLAANSKDTGDDCAYVVFADMPKTKKWNFTFTRISWSWRSKGTRKTQRQQTLRYHFTAFKLCFIWSWKTGCREWIHKPPLSPLCLCTGFVQQPSSSKHFRILYSFVLFQAWTWVQRTDHGSVGRKKTRFSLNGYQRQVESGGLG